MIRVKTLCLILRTQIELRIPTQPSIYPFFLHGKFRNSENTRFSKVIAGKTKTKQKPSSKRTTSEPLRAEECFKPSLLGSKIFVNFQKRKRFCELGF